MGQKPIQGSNPSLSATVIYAPVAQLDRVPGYELGGREFESLRARYLFQIFDIIDTFIEANFCR